MAYGALGDQLIQWAMGKEEQDRKQGKGQAPTIEELRRDVQEAEHRGDLARLSSALFELGYVMFEARDLASAAELLQKAGGIQLGIGQRQSYAFTLFFLGSVRASQQRFDESRAEFHRALAIFSRAGLSNRRVPCAW